MLYLSGGSYCPDQKENPENVKLYTVMLLQCVRLLLPVPMSHVTLVHIELEGERVLMYPLPMDKEREQTVRADCFWSSKAPL